MESNIGWHARGTYHFCILLLSYNRAYTIINGQQKILSAHKVTKARSGTFSAQDLTEKLKKLFNYDLFRQMIYMT